MNNEYQKFIPSFREERAAVCGESIGPIEPLDYPANYMIDDQFPVTDAETGAVRLE